MIDSEISYPCFESLSLVNYPKLAAHFGSVQGSLESHSRGCQANSQLFASFVAAEFHYLSQFVTLVVSSDSSEFQ